MAADRCSIFHLETGALSVEERAAWLASAEAHLDADERARLERYIPQEKKLEFLLGRVLLKGVLGGVYGVAAPRILCDPEGSKPRVEGGAVADADAVACTERVALPSFNLSHSHGALALIVGPPGSAVGIDIERIRESVRPDLVAYTMREEERAQIVDAASFTLAWTAKEAYMKLVGSGLAIAPRRLRVDHERRTVTDCERDETRPFAWERRGAWVVSWMAEGGAPG